MRFIAYAKCLIHIFGPYPILFTQLIYPLCKILSVVKVTDAFLKNALCFTVFHLATKLEESIIVFNPRFTPWTSDFECGL